MINKIKKGDKVRYGQYLGSVEFVNLKEKVIDCIFFIENKKVCILFDFDFYVIPTGKFLDLPRLEKI